MNREEQQYLDILKDILDNGEYRNNRTNVPALSVFGRMMRFDLSQHFPLLTTKRVFFRGVFEELLLFINGRTDTLSLEEKGINIWKGNTSREFLDSRGLSFLPAGDLGCAYSHQWRNFGGEHPLIPETKGNRGVDQIERIVQRVRDDPWSRRIYLTGSNPQQEHLMALPCCHHYTQFSCNPDTRKLSCFFQIRSADFYLGTPWNCSFYALFTCLLAKLTGYTPGELVYAGVDTHLYQTHVEAAKEQLTRKPREFPTLNIKKDIKSLEELEALQFEDVEIIGYDPYPSIKAEMVV